MIIYLIENKINGKKYVGMTTVGLKKRWIQHKSSSHAKIKKTALQQAISKYGPENFEIRELEKCKSFEELQNREQYWIKFFKSFGRSGYNMTPGGEDFSSDQVREMWRKRRRIIFLQVVKKPPRLLNRMKKGSKFENLRKHFQNLDPLLYF